MRTVSVLASGLLLVATLSGCADDPAPDRAAAPSGASAVRLTGDGVDTPAQLVAQLREGVGEALQVTGGDDPVAPSFRLTDQSSSMFGQLTGTGPRDTALFVEAGESCGE